ncbi:MAG: 4'-phosphopantetheinyl transferase superfamily protein [Lachnospiraceae bacterium]|nr:4'-phosphopantetheinyl transferase superfamily protein [Lachnospiraceae bacterium]
MISPGRFPGLFLVLTRRLCYHDSVMVKAFYTIAPVSDSTDSRIVRENVRRLHDTAWQLLAAALHQEFPSLFPVPDARSLPETVRGAQGKPAFADTALPCFSISHSRNAAVCALDDGFPVGVDIQDMTGNFECDSIARRFLHKQEQELLFAIGDERERRRMFYRIFSCKEAHVKRTGAGMSQDFTGFFVNPGDRSVRSDDGKIIGRLYCELDIAPPLKGYSFAVSSPRPIEVDEFRLQTMVIPDRG